MTSGKKKPGLKKPGQSHPTDLLGARPLLARREEREIARRLSDLPAGEPPADLLDRLRADVPDDLGSRLDRRGAEADGEGRAGDDRPTDEDRRTGEGGPVPPSRLPRRWLAAAAVLVTLVGGGYLAWQLTAGAPGPAAWVEERAEERAGEEAAAEAPAEGLARQTEGAAAKEEPVADVPGVEEPTAGGRAAEEAPSGAGLRQVSPGVEAERASGADAGSVLAESVQVAPEREAGGRTGPQEPPAPPREGDGEALREAGTASPKALEAREDREAATSGPATEKAAPDRTAADRSSTRSTADGPTAPSAPSPGSPVPDAFQGQPVAESDSPGESGIPGEMEPGAPAREVSAAAPSRRLLAPLPENLPHGWPAAVASLEEGRLPPPSAVPVREAVASQPYGDPLPELFAAGEGPRVTVAAAPSPWAAHPGELVLFVHVAPPPATHTPLRGFLQIDSSVVERWRPVGTDRWVVTDPDDPHEAVGVVEAAPGGSLAALFAVRLRGGPPVEGELGRFVLRRLASGGEGSGVRMPPPERPKTVPVGEPSVAASWSAAPPDLRLAAVAGELAEVLRRRSPAASLETVREEARTLAADLPPDDPRSAAATELADLAERTAELLTAEGGAER